MELCSLPTSSQSRFNNDRRVKLGSPVSPHPRLTRRPPSIFISRVAVGDFKGSNPDDDGSQTPRKPDYEEYASKKKLEMMGSLLKEGYGVGALVTAGLIKGVNLTTDFLKQVSNRNSAIKGSSVRRYGNLKKLNKRRTSQSGTRVTDSGRNAVSDSLTSSVNWSKHEIPDPEEEDQNQTPVFEEQSSSMEDPVFEQDPVLEQDPVFEEEAVEESGISESIQDAVFEDPVLQNEMEDASSTQTTGSASAEEFTPMDDVSEQPASIPVDEDDQRLSADTEASSESNNIESFSNKLEDVEPIDEPGSSESVAFSRAMEILDSIASFEEETGESVDEDVETEEPQKESPPIKPQPSNDEIKAEKESKKRFRATKKENRKQRSQKKPVNVVKPSKRGDWRSQSGSSVPSGSTTGLKGLDYIKSYAKERQDSLEKDKRKDSFTSESNSAFFKPPSILQGSNRVQGVRGSASGSYSRWNEVQRLQKVREIGTVLWLGKGGGNGGNNGGNGGGGGRRDGSSNDGSNDKDWWIQVGVSLLTMTILVFILLTTIANHVEKRNSRIKKHP